MNTPDDKGVTKREEMEQLDKSAHLLPSYKRNPILDVECPKGYDYLFNIFFRLRSTVGMDGNIKDSEILSFMKLRQYDLSLWEIEQITNMDSTASITTYNIKYNKK